MCSHYSQEEAYSRVGKHVVARGFSKMEQVSSRKPGCWGLALRISACSNQEPLGLAECARSTNAWRVGGVAKFSRATGDQNSNHCGVQLA